MPVEGEYISLIIAGPLFNDSIGDLLAKLRLTGIKNDGLVIVKEVILQVRMGFYDQIGESRIAQILLSLPTDNPTSLDSITRLKAGIAEVLWCRMLLLRRLPSLFMDASDKTQEIWDQEGLTRQAGASELDKELDRIQDELNDMLSDLAGDAEADDSSLLVYVSGVPDNQPRPGDTAFGNGKYVGRNLWPSRGDTNNF